MGRRVWHSTRHVEGRAVMGSDNRTALLAAVLQLSMLFPSVLLAGVPTSCPWLLKMVEVAGVAGFLPLRWRKSQGYMRSAT